MNLSLYQVRPSGMALAHAPKDRDWLPPNANRCPPIQFANARGLQVLCPDDVQAIWNGRNAPDSLDVWTGGEEVKSTFGHGLLTFYLPWVARVPPGFRLRVSGPCNYPKVGVVPVEAEVENTHATFTVNWAFTSAGSVHFKAGEPIATLSIVQAMDIDQVVINPIESHTALHHEYKKWSESRRKLQEARA